MARVYKDQGKFAQAEPLYEQLVAMYEKTNDPNDRELAANQIALADVYQAQGKFAQAELLYDRAQPIIDVDNICDNDLGSRNQNEYKLDLQLTSAQHATLVPLMRELDRKTRAEEDQNNPVMRALKEGKITQAEFTARYNRYLGQLSDESRIKNEYEYNAILHKVLTPAQFAAHLKYLDETAGSSERLFSLGRHHDHTLK